MRERKSEKLTALVELTAGATAMPADPPARDAAAASPVMTWPGSASMQTSSRIGPLVRSATRAVGAWSARRSNASDRRAARSAGSVVCGRTCELFVLCLEPYAHPRHIGQSLIRWESLSSNILEIAGARPLEAARASAAATAAPRLYAIWGIDKGETKLQHQLTGTRAAGTPQAALRPKALRPNAPRRPTLPAVSPLPGGVSDAPGSSHTRSGTPSP